MSPPDEAEVTGAQQTLIAVGALLERRIDDRSGKRLGRVVEVMLVAGRGEIAYVVVATGGWLGFGEDLHAVAWADFRVDPWNGKLSLDVDAAAFAARDSFDKDRWPVRV